MTENKPTIQSAQLNPRFFSILPDGKLTSHKTIEKALENTRDQGYVWFDYCEPTLKQLEPLILHFGIPPPFDRRQLVRRSTAQVGSLPDLFFYDLQFL